jgi:hypothetical protein
VDGELWNTPAQKAAAVARIGRWRGYRPAPLKRISGPKQNGTQRPLSIPTLADRARQAVYLQALQPMAETTGDQHSDGFRPKRRGADALDQCFKVLRQKTSATWFLEGDIQGFFDNMRFACHGGPRARQKATGSHLGGIALRRQRKAVLDDHPPPIYVGRTELIQRLLADSCTMCER